MPRKYEDVRDWILELRAQAERNADLFLPIFGARGDGKSTLALQLGSALDPRLSVDQIHFGIGNYLANAPPPDDEVTYELRRRKLGNGHRVQIGDEMELSRRMAMWGLSLDFQMFEKDCRGLNLDQIICFPDEEDFDRIYAFCTKWKVRVVRRGLFEVYERQERFRAMRRGAQPERYYVWVKVGSWTFVENRGPLWGAYLGKKEAHMASLGGAYREAARSATSGVDFADAVAHFSSLRAMYDERAGSRASIHEGP